VFAVLCIILIAAVALLYCALITHTSAELWDLENDLRNRDN
jgi:hypothetical protein